MNFLNKKAQIKSNTNFNSISRSRIEQLILMLCVFCYKFYILMICVQSKYCFFLRFFSLTFYFTFFLFLLTIGQESFLFIYFSALVWQIINRKIMMIICFYFLRGGQRWRFCSRDYWSTKKLAKRVGQGRKIIKAHGINEFWLKRAVELSFPVHSISIYDSVKGLSWLIVQKDH